MTPPTSAPMTCGSSPRLIPVHAGSTTTPSRKDTTNADHPRSRGEHKSESRRAHSDAGSSPLTRGALNPRLHYPLPLRIIPAHAGSTPSSTVPTGRPRDHPRSRGEHQAPAGPTLNEAGSSPLARGAPMQKTAHLADHGIIPADAGSTRMICGRRRPRWDHPRSRGEHMNAAIDVMHSRGSSPLTRGARVRPP